MKKLILLALSLMSASLMAQSQVSTITCNVNEILENKTIPVKVEFLVANLGSNNAELVQHPQAEDEMDAVLVSPRTTGEQWTSMTNLNAQGGDLRVSDDKIVLYGDGAGYTFVDFVLFKNTNYKKGYVRVYGSGVQLYQKVNCSVTTHSN